MGLLPFISASLAHVHRRTRWSEHTHTSSSRAFHAGRCSHTSHLSRMRPPNGQGCVRYTSGDAQIHTFSPFPLSLSSLLSPSVCAFLLSRCDFHVQGQYEPSTGNIAPSNPEHDKGTDAGTLMVPKIIYQQSASLFLIQTRVLYFCRFSS